MSNPSELKARNEARLQQLGFAVNPHLPEIEALSELTPQSAQAVAERALVLAQVAGTGFGRPPGETLAALEDIGLAFSLTRAEREHLRRASYSDSERGWAQWLVEALNACSWCLEKTDDLDPLSKPSERLHAIFGLCPDPQAFALNATLRPIEQIHEFADLYYRVHWAARDARLTGRPCPVVESLPFMRRWALDWVVGTPCEWDDVPHDT